MNKDVAVVIEKKVESISCPKGWDHPAASCLFR
jgi:hypothetical protein